MVEKFVPANQMSEVFSQLAEIFKEEESRAAAIPGKPLTEELPTKEPVAQPSNTSPSTQDQIPLLETARTVGVLEQRSEIEGENEEIQKPVDEKPTEKLQEWVDEEGMESDDEKNALSERARQSLDREEFPGTTEFGQRGIKKHAGRGSSASCPKREAAERKRKGKNVATPNESKKSSPASLGVVIRDTVIHPTQPTQEDDQYVGAFEWVEIDVDQKLLDDMIQFDDPKLQRSCGGRVSELKPAKSGEKNHLRSLRAMGVKEQFVDYFRGMGFGWILEHAPCGVPVNLAKEFFTSFHFESTTIWTRSPFISGFSIKKWP